jgi:hypothetical protein
VSPEEEEILRKMKALRSEAEEIRSRLEGQQEEAEEREAWEEELQKLRKQWQVLDQEREAANRRKLIRLGHLAPEDGQEEK